MSSAPPSKPLMSQNPSLRGPLLACSRRATDDCNRRRPPSAHAHAPTECSSVPRSSHLCHAPTPPQITPSPPPRRPLLQPRRLRCPRPRGQIPVKVCQIPGRPSAPGQSAPKSRGARGLLSMRQNPSKSVKSRTPLGPLLPPPRVEAAPSRQRPRDAPGRLPPVWPRPGGYPRPCQRRLRPRRCMWADHTS